MNKKIVFIMGFSLLCLSLLITSCMPEDIIDDSILFEGQPLCSTGENINNSLSEESAYGKEMSLEEALIIAQDSDCVNEGTLKEDYFYNSNSRTWWIGLNVVKEGCNPACVVFENKSVEINWRCTGLLVE